MSEDFTLRCGECGRSYAIERIEPGMGMECPECGGALAAPGLLTFHCPNCDAESEPLELPLDESIICPKCDGEMRVSAQDLSEEEPEAATEPEAAAGAPPEPEAPEKLDAPLEKTLALAPGSVGAGEGTPSEAEGEPSGGESSDGGDSEDNATIALAGAADGERKPSSLRLAKGPLSREFSLDQPAGLYEDAVQTRMLGNKTRSSRSIMGSKIGGGLTGKEAFGKFQILEEIARGGMGIVYKVMDPDLRRELALKVLIEQEGASEEVIKRFMREARAAANLQHPNIIGVHEMGEIDGQYYFTMDYVRGVSFQEVIAARGAKSGMSVNEYVAHMLDVCHALQVAHERNIFHRDLKPANIMLENETDRVILMDFGLAKDNASMSIQSMTGAVLGSPAYMSPEQAQGLTHDIDHRTDVYSMGVILYEGATSNQPFRGESVFETITKVVYDEPVPPRNIAPGDVPKNLQAIILKCMEKSPSARYQSMAELADDLNAFLSGKRIRAKGPSLARRGWRRLRRHPVLFGAALISPLLAIAVGLAVLIVARPSFVAIAEKAVASGDPRRQLGALRELAARMRETKPGAGPDEKRALVLFRRFIDPQRPEAAEIAIATVAARRDGDALEPLMALTLDADAPERLRVLAMNAIAAIGEVKAPKDPALTEFITAAIHRQADPMGIRVAATQALRLVLGGAATPILADVAANGDNPSALRVAALKALSDKIAIGGASMKKILPLCGADDEAVAKAADEALKKARTKTDVFNFYGLGNAIGNTYVKVAEIEKMNADRNRKIAQYLDGDGDWSGKKKPKKAEKKSELDLIVEKLHHGDLGERMGAAFDLGQHGDPDAVPELAKSLTVDEDKGVRRIVIRSLLVLAPKRKPEPETVFALARSDDDALREQGVFLFGALFGRERLHDLTSLAKHERNRRVLAMHVRVIGKIGDPKALPVVYGILERYGAKSRSLAKACVETLGYFGEDGVTYLIRALGHTFRDETRRAAHRELVEVCGEDFGLDREKWRSWASGRK